MHDYHNDHAHHAITQQQNRRAARGDGVLEGCQVSPGDASESVESDHDGGYVRLEGEVCQLAPNAVTHSDGHADNPRRDVVIAERTGPNTASARAIEGGPGPWPTVDGQEVRYAEAWTPPPPDTTGEDGAVLAIVTVGPGATQSAGILDVEDRRREPSPAPRHPRETGPISTPPVNLEGDDFYAHPLRVYGDSWLTVWSVSQWLWRDGERVPWEDGVGRQVLFMEPNDSGTDTIVENITIAENRGDPLFQTAVGGSSDEWYPYWIKLRNEGAGMDANEYWGVWVDLTIDRRPA